MANLDQYEPHPDYELDIPVLTVQAYSKPDDSRTYYRVVDSKNVVVASDIPDLHMARTLAVASRLVSHTRYLSEAYAKMLLGRLDLSNHGLVDIITGDAPLSEDEEVDAVSDALMVLDVKDLVEFVDEVSPERIARMKRA